MTKHIAVDVGAESGRVMVAAWDGARLRLREAARFPNQPIRQGTSLRWDLPRILDDVERALHTVSDENVASIGVDAWGCDYGLMDEAGALVELPYHYRDHRTDGVMAAVLERIGRERVYGATGIQCLPFNTLYQLAAAQTQSPETLSRAARLLTIPDLLNHRLTGRTVCEFTNATTTQCVDGRTGQWALDLIGALGLPSHLFGEIVSPGTVLGPPVSGPRPGFERTLVVAPACHDTGSAFAAVESGGRTALLSCGTWSLLGTEMPSAVITDRARELNFTNEGGVGGTVRLLKNIGGLWLLQACRASWSAAGSPASYDELVEAARNHTKRRLAVLIDPDDPALLGPADMPRAIDDYCRGTGQPVPEGPAAMTRAILESLAVTYRLVLDALEEVSGRSFEVIRMVGGGSRNRLLAQFTADATERPVMAGPVEATALGNVAVQLVAVGAVPSLPEARAMVDRSFPAERFEPRPDTVWRAAAARLRDLRQRA